MLHRADVHWNSDSFDIENKYLGKPIDADVVVELDPDTGLVSRKFPDRTQMQVNSRLQMKMIAV